MAIRGVTSILSDREYIKVLELELRELRAMVERMALDLKSARQGR